LRHRCEEIIPARARSRRPCHTRCRERLLHGRGDDNEVVLCPPNLGLEAGVTEDVQQLIGAADHAVCSIQWRRFGDGGMRLYDIGQHEPSAVGQPLRDSGKQVCFQRGVDVVQRECRDDQFERPYRQSILEAAESQFCSRAEDSRRSSQFFAAFVEAHGTRRGVRLETPS
jgi:hypothetical protein